ncbi:spermidine/putrescine transport system permease protein [Rhodoligotrophos appendicifer]|uniref:ABC transporter permease n=1 Tax=Rhodoligotrophos appendicifer TaxID=987056 RepID=UPI001186381E|nr:ABC transporter permease [Rhodoligotrophos appendicifer]
MTAATRSRIGTAAMVAPAALFFIVLLVLPLVVVLVYSFGLRAPAGGYQPGFTLDNYLNLPARAAAFLNTITLAPLGTLVTVLIAYPLAYFLAVKVSPRWRTLLLVLVIVPFWASQLLRIYAWMMILGNRGIPSLLFAAGLGDIRLLNTPFAVLLGMVYGYLPLMVFPIYVSLEKLDRRLLEASADLGASPFRTFLQVTLPLSLPGVATGSMLVFILLMGEFIIPAFLGGGKVFFIGNALVDLFLQSRNWPFGAAVSVALVAIMLVVIVIYMRFILGRSGTRRMVLS